MTQNTQSEETIPPPNPHYVRFLLAVVIGLGALIMIALAVIIGTIVKRANDVRGDAPKDAPFGQIEWPIPQGAESMSVTSDEGHIILHLKTKEGAIVGRVRLPSVE